MRIVDFLESKESMDFLIGEQRGLYIKVLYLHMYKYVIENIENAAPGYHPRTIYIYTPSRVQVLEGAWGAFGGGLG